MLDAGQLHWYAEACLRAGSDGRRVAEGFGLLHARDDDRYSGGGGDHHHCGCRVPADENGQEGEGCWRSEEREEVDQVGEGVREGQEQQECEGLSNCFGVCLQ